MIQNSFYAGLQLLNLTELSKSACALPVNFGTFELTKKPQNNPHLEFKWPCSEPTPYLPRQSKWFLKYKLYSGTLNIVVSTEFLGFMYENMLRIPTSSDLLKSTKFSTSDLKAEKALVVYHFTFQICTKPYLSLVPISPTLFAM